MSGFVKNSHPINLELEFESALVFAQFAIRSHQV
jgi:hypothetical protein